MNVSFFCNKQYAIRGSDKVRSHDPEEIKWSNAITKNSGVQIFKYDKVLESLLNKISVTNQIF